MEVQFLEDHKLSPPMEDYHANVDTSRPFRSVKEAVAIFGERYLAREIYPPKKFTFPNQETPHYSPSPLLTHDPRHEYSTSLEESSIETNDHHRLISDASRQLEETNMEVKMLKERKSETEVTLASLNAELHKNMLKLALAKENAADKVVEKAEAIASIKPMQYVEIEDKVKVTKEKQRNSIETTTLAKKLSLGEEEGLFVGTNKRKKEKVMKKKKLITLVGRLFTRKKETSTTMHNPLFSYAINQDEQEKYS